MNKDQEKCFDAVRFFMDKASNSNEPMLIVITAHIVSENIIDQIIARKWIEPKLITENRDYTYSIKLKALYSSGFLPEYLYKSLESLNKMRNEYAHELKRTKTLKFINPIEIGESGIREITLDPAQFEPNEFCRQLSQFLLVLVHNLCIFSNHIKSVKRLR